MIKIFLTINQESNAMTASEISTIVLSSISLLFVFIGGVFAAIKWSQGLKYKRSDIVKPLIDNVRSNETIAMVMDMIDWDEYFCYDGEFHKRLFVPENPLDNYNDKQIFKMIDETLSVFSYICYLRIVGSLKKKDMKLFEYEIRRLFDNKHICNYLYSLFHWSNYLKVHMSFVYLIKYALKKKYIKKTFLLINEQDGKEENEVDNVKYECYLQIPPKTETIKRKIYL